MKTASTNLLWKMVLWNDGESHVGKFHFLAGAVLLIVAVLAWPAASVSANDKGETLVIPWTVTFQIHQQSPDKISSGDTLQAEYTLTGRHGGTSDWYCTVVGTRFLCNGIIRLPAGDIYAASGPIDEQQPAAILGGTRAYVGVSGEFTQEELTENTGVWKLKLRRSHD
ncbi:MAG TPA: hypothetical protein VLU94_02685 [Candidatus Nitrosotalea sp.]|nr:hypothetical protein [Candidatus Nitrosotalea sp.]